MSDPASAFPPVRPVLRVVSGFLQTTDGWPVYRFVPYAAAIAKGGASPVVPWNDEWPSYVASWVTNYAPLPVAMSETPFVQQSLAFQERPGAKDDAPQALYRGWPLYVFNQDAPGAPPQGIVAGQFELVPVEVFPVADKTGATDHVTWPDLYGGP